MRRIILATSLLVALFGVLAACGQPAASGPTLTGVLWQWTEQTIGEPATIPNPENYTITFATDGTFSAKVDCNQASGAFTTTAEGGITISPGPMTLAACPEGSLDSAYIAGLSGASGFSITGDELTLTTATGTMTFAPG